MWAKNGNGAGLTRGNGIAVDNSSNCYLTGYVTGELVFGSSISAAGSYDAFVAKLNSSGDIQWVKAIGSSGTDIGSKIVLDHEQNPVITGSFQQTIDVGGIALASDGEDDVFVAKFNKDSGNPIWAKRFGGTASNAGIAISTTTTGDLYVSGSFFGTFELNGNTFTAGTNLNSFILKLNASGDVVWAKEIDGSDWNNALAIATDFNGNCIVTGYFTGSATLGSTTLNASGNEDVFIAKYSLSDGSVQWAKKAGGTNYDNAKAIVCDNSNNFYITGYFTNTASFGGSNVISNENSRDIFVAKYNSDGNIQWVKTAGGEETDGGESIAVSSAGILYVTGFYRDFSVTFGATILQNSGGDDAFFWKIWQD